MVTDFVAHLPQALSWPFLIALLIMIVPRVLDRIPGIIRACTLRRLGKAVDEKADWQREETVARVLKLMSEFDRQPVSGEPDDAGADQSGTADGTPPSP
ncbi:hypothetical protein [Plantactinospora soyae]|uniref:Uncharacterized protein n=1 Tax=Plantactinospora soyae TaxID=1544732 RepID=A0A927MB54_9ACTN|nr:hypothetical protein [Plantactinospora soyae]MBE1489906.1 hypothetical protein [Plantactinospora soyae]